MTYNKSLPNIKKTIDDNRHILSIKQTTISNHFPEKPRITYRRNKNLGNILGKHTLKNNKIVSSNKPNQGKCQPCLKSKEQLVLQTNEHHNRIHQQENRMTISKYITMSIVSHFMSYISLNAFYAIPNRTSENVKQYLI